MSINQAIGNAFSGLAAASRATEIVSRNIANASTEGYSATSLARSQMVNGVEGAGVRVTGVERAGNPFVTADRRRLEAGAGRAEAEAQIMRDLSDLISDPDGGDSLAGRFTALENALRGLADTPESSAMQATAAAAGRALATRFNTLSTQTGQMVGDLEADVQRKVQTVNTALKKIAQLNTTISNGRATGKDTTALEDERDRQIDLVNGIVPIRAKDREPGGMMISTVGGALLVEGSAREITWDRDSGFKVSDIPTSAAPPSGGLMGGTLEASITALTQTIPAFLEQIDALAIDLIQRFQNIPNYPEPDSSDPLTAMLGLFVLDNAGQAQRLPSHLGDPLVPVEVPPTPAQRAEIAALYPQGIVASLRFNPAFDPAAGGTASLLAETNPLVDVPPAEPYPTALMTAMRGVTNSAISGITGSFNATDMAIALVSLREVNASQRESDASFQQAASRTVRERELSLTAVDTDAELQALMRLEQAYAANARILQVANGLIDRLLEI